MHIIYEIRWVFRALILSSSIRRSPKPHTPYSNMFTATLPRDVNLDAKILASASASGPFIYLFIYLFIIKSYTEYNTD